jgi:predicted enzyme related to lactoylglutathione lyase
MGNLIVWADVPVVDLDRALAFYSAVTGLEPMKIPGMDGVGLLRDPSIDPDAGVMTVSIDLYVGGKPSHDGATIYLNPNGEIDAMVARVVPAGGKVLDEKAFMGDMVGWVAFIEDTEGNRVGIQQPGDANGPFA